MCKVLLYIGHGSVGLLRAWLSNGNNTAVIVGRERMGMESATWLTLPFTVHMVFRGDHPVSLYYFPFETEIKPQVTANSKWGFPLENCTKKAFWREWVLVYLPSTRMGVWAGARGGADRMWLLFYLQTKSITVWNKAVSRIVYNSSLLGFTILSLLFSLPGPLSCFTVQWNWMIKGHGIVQEPHAAHPSGTLSPYPTPAEVHGKTPPNSSI